MARWQYGDRYEKRAAKSLTLENRQRARRYLDRLSQNPPPGNLNLKPMEGTNGLLWECKAGGQFRFILRRMRDANGDYFIVEYVGPHDIYKQYSP
jgi:hypothetical protein